MGRGGVRRRTWQDRWVLITSHVLAGATIGTILSRSPGGAFVAGVVSHFAMDACPHWSPARDDPRGRDRFLQVARCDGCAGLAAMALAAGLVGPQARRATVAAMVGAALPDIDKPCLEFFGFNPFPHPVRRFHDWVQREAPHRLPHEVVMAATLAGVMVWRTLRARGAAAPR